MTPSKKIAHRGAGRVAYLSVREKVEEMLAAGHDVAAIYASLSAKLPIGYKQFAKYVQRFSDSHKIRPFGWTPRVKAPPTVKLCAPSPVPSRPKPPTYQSPTRNWTIDELLDGKPERDLFS